jgi:hypothetical protein
VGSLIQILKDIETEKESQDILANYKTKLETDLKELEEETENLKTILENWG